MRIALVGASGRSGSRIAAEALDRGHEVTGIARKPEQIAAHAKMRAVQGDANDPKNLASLLEGHDVVVLANTWAGIADQKALLEAIKRSGAPRLAVAGGSATLYVSPGVQRLDMPDFPEFARPEALGHRAFLDLLGKESGVVWTFLSPSGSGPNFAPGERTGKFRLGGDDLLVDANGKSSISVEDYAVALVDELENPRHNGRRFTVGY